jgi:hypothetical protein
MRKRESFGFFFFVPCSFVALFNFFLFLFRSLENKALEMQPGGAGETKKRPRSKPRPAREPWQSRVSGRAVPRSPEGILSFAPLEGFAKSFSFFTFSEKKNDPLPSSLSFFQLQELEIERALSFFFFLGQPGKK